ncbi:ATP-binding protein [Helicobacter sp. T3_23-1056]
MQNLFDEAYKKEIAKTKERFFEAIKADENFVGYLYDLNYDTTNVLVNDYFKNDVSGVPHGCFLMAIYTNEVADGKTEGILLRVIGVADIPQKKEIIESITDAHISKKESKRDIEPDAYTKVFYQWNGLSCRVLGTFFFDSDKKLCFGTDMENFIGAHNYKVYKPQKNELNIIINENIEIKENEPREPFGKLRYSSSKSCDKEGKYAPQVYLRTNDIIARRSAFFGMTRMGKSNTIKIIISAIESLNQNKAQDEKIGQIIFDINGEYTFSNEQDKGSIYEKFKDNVIRFSTSLKKAQQHSDVKAVQYNFYKDETLEESFNLLCDEIIANKKADYISHFTNISMFEIIEDKNSTEYRNQQRKKALYKCILHKAKFANRNEILKFKGFSGFGESVPESGLSIKEATAYFEKIQQDLSNVDKKYRDDKDWEALLKVFHGTRVSGYKSLMSFNHLHSLEGINDYKQEIDKALRDGKIVLVDLSTASSETQEKYIERLCRYIFGNSMEKFTNEETPDFIQMYFEEAHNIFPKDDKDLKNIYNRLAKEGAKLKIGISYSTQEVSSIAPSILKNTQNWFISHLNNKDEVKTLEKYYDFADFSQSIIRNSDVGFARVKLFSNNFIIPVQIDEFKI